MARLRRCVAALVLALFGLAVLTGLGEQLLPVLGLSQPGMLLTGLAAEGGKLFLALLFAHLALALLLGRVFCSWLCPLGIAQDVAARFSFGRRKTPRHARYAAGGLWRLIIPVILLAGFVSGVTWLFGLAEPYSLFVRSAQSVGQPLYALAHNGLALFGDKSGLFALPLTARHLDFTGLALALPLLIIVLAFARSRGWCNSVCPVGALLGLAGGAALFRPRFTARCKACGLCERRCKARCLESAPVCRQRRKASFSERGLDSLVLPPEEKRCLTKYHGKPGRFPSIDASRCVACYNCLEACPRGGLSLAPRLFGRRAGTAAASGTALSHVSANALGPTSAMPPGFASSRAFLRGGLSALALLALAPAAKAARTLFAPDAGTADAGTEDAGAKDASDALPALVDRSPRHLMPVLPPGAESLTRLESLCTGCHSCVSACPPGVLTVSGPFAWERAGISRMALPGMDFFRAFCQVGCTRCTEVCPSKALRPVTLAAKKRLQLGRAVFVEPLCVVITKKTRCGACAEHCPTGALIMTPQPALQGAVLPRIDQSLCIGCGACQFACPVRPAQAIEVVALARHTLAAPPRPKQADIEAGGDFPF